MKDERTNHNRFQIPPTNLPSENGPGLSPLPPKNLAEMGMLYAKYWAMTTSEKIAPMAFAPAKASSPRRRDTKAANHTQRTGEWDRLLTWYSHREKGRPPSRENAKIWREVVVNCHGVNRRI